MIEIDINPVAFLTVRWYGIFVALGISVLILWMMWQVRRGAKLTYEAVFTAALVGIPSAIVVSRLLHVIDRWGYYGQHPGQIIGGSGLTIYGAVSSLPWAIVYQHPASLAPIGTAVHPTPVYEIICCWFSGFSWACTSPRLLV